MLSLSRRLRNEDGNILVAVVLISMLIGMLAALTLATGEQADWASAKDRNHEVALGVAEAGVHDALTRVESTVANAYVSGLPAFNGATDQGTYTASVTRVGDNFIVDAQGTVAPANRQQRKRHVKVTLMPPELFPDAGYALFSKQDLYLKNNNEVYDGDIWANGNLTAEGGAIIEGSITAATGSIKLGNGADVSGYVWAGGRKCDIDGQNPCTSGWGISLEQNGHIGKWAKSSVTAPNCFGEDPNLYKVMNDGEVIGDLTSRGPIVGSGTVGPPGQAYPGVCTSAQPIKDPPTFTFNRWNYDQSTYHPSSGEPYSAEDFNYALNNGLDGINKNALVGTFVIKECGAGIVNISGAELAGDVTIVTNPEGPCDGVKGARIRTEGVGDSLVPTGSRAKFVLVSHYEAPAGSSCSDQNDAYCAVSAKNHFDSTCKTATLVYADNGPVSMKNDTGPNDNQMCGSIIANGIHMKNDLQLTYDPVFDRLIGFGPVVYEIARWEELPVS